MSTPEFEHIHVEERGPVLIVTINRPERMNVLSSIFYEEIKFTYHNLSPHIRAIVFTGAGDRAFCTGLDLKNAAQEGQPRAEGSYHTVMRYSPVNYDVWLPFIVAVNGLCAGAGFHFLADADVALAAEHATFVDPHVNVGQVSALEPIHLSLRIGIGNAQRLAVLGRAGRMDAEEALRISLVDKVVPADTLLDEAIRLAAEVAKGSPAAIERTKRATREIYNKSIEDVLESGWDLVGEHRHNHPDAIEGPRAFAEKREPQWTLGLHGHPDH